MRLSETDAEKLQELQLLKYHLPRKRYPINSEHFKSGNNLFSDKGRGLRRVMLQRVSGNFLKLTRKSSYRATVISKIIRVRNYSGRFIYLFI